MELSSRPVIAVLVGLVAGIISFGAASYVLATPQSYYNSSDPADSGEKTYELYDFQLVYQFSPAPNEASSGDTTVGVKFSSKWSAKVFPGETSCLVTVRSADGKTIGSQLFSYASADPQVTGRNPMSVSIEGVPVSADGACEASDQGRSDYAFEHSASERMTAAESSAGVAGTRIMFRVTWLGESPPGPQLCQSRVELSDGSVIKEIPFLYEADRPSSYAVGVPGADPSDIRESGIACVS